MKKLFLFLTLLLSAVGVSADNWMRSIVDESQYNGSTVIYAKLSVTNVENGYFAIGAFIDGELRGRAYPEYGTSEGTTVNGEAYYTIRVWGLRGVDEGKTITFKAGDQQSWPPASYTLKTSKTFTWDSQKTEGEPSNPAAVFTLTVPTSYNLDKFPKELEKGKKYTLRNYVTPVPADATLPDDLAFRATTEEVPETLTVETDEILANQYCTIKDGVLTATNTYIGDLHLYMWVGDGLVVTEYDERQQPISYTDATLSDLGNMPAAHTTFSIVLHAKEVKILVTDVIRVRYRMEDESEHNIDDSGKLNRALAQGVGFNLLPVGATDQVQWEIEGAQTIANGEMSNGILNYDPNDNWFQLLAAGRARVRPYVVVNGTKIVPVNDAWITVEVYVPVDEITLSQQVIRANVGDKNLYARLASLVTVTPDNATDKTWSVSFDQEGLVTQQTTANGLVLTPVKAGRCTITITSNEKVEANDATAGPAGPVTAQLGLVIEDPVKTLKFTESPYYATLEVDEDTRDLAGELWKNTTLGSGQFYIPGQVAVTTGSDVVSIVNADGATGATGAIAYFTENGFNSQLMAMKEGDATLKFTLTWNDYDNWTDMTKAAPELTADFTLQVHVTKELKLQNFMVTYTPAVAGVSDGTLVLTPNPAKAKFEPSDVQLSFNTQPQMSKVWASKVYSATATANNPLEYNIHADIPLYLTFTAMVGNERVPVSNTDGSVTTENNSYMGIIEVPYGLNLTKGWSWRSNPWGSAITPNLLEEVYGSSLIEIRTQRDLVYNDSKWGYYGSLMHSDMGLEPYQCYKINMKEALSTKLSGNGYYGSSEVGTAIQNQTMTLQPGWYWIGNPYFYDRLLSNVMSKSANTQTLEGVIVIGQDGSAEFANGKWNPESFMLKAGQGYIVKNPGTVEISVDFINELMNLEPGNDAVPTGLKGFNAQTDVWKYDATRYMDNMTMVSVLDGVAVPEDYTIGAFVNGECRGEGFVENGIAYITVHCAAGEQVSFMLHNILTDETLSVLETVTAEMRIGSVKEPFVLHTGTQTAISNVNGTTTVDETFDVAGRRTNANQRGITIRRMADGTVRKVVVK